MVTDLVTVNGNIAGQVPGLAMFRVRSSGLEFPKFLKLRYRYHVLVISLGV